MIIHQLTIMKCIPRDLIMMRRFAIQTIKGDIQIVPKASFKDVINLFNNLTK